MAIVHRIGTPETDSEARAIKRFAKGLPDDCFVFHNFEVTTGRGLPYEYDIAVLTPHALYHVEVKGYHGEIRGNPMQWIFENGGVFRGGERKQDILPRDQFGYQGDDVGRDP